MSARFGPAGRPDSFAAMGYKKTPEIPVYLSRFGLNAFEYQCGRGVRYVESDLLRLKEAAVAADIALSVHAPYYISLSSTEEEKRLNSVGYITDTAKAARIMGGDRIVVHSGSCGKISREEALELAKGTLRLALDELERLGLADITVCPETMGKVNQLGTLLEVLELCSIDERLLPCIDFGHLYARSCGEQFAAATAPADYAALLDTLAARLGDDRAVHFHAHFSRIAYTKGGEKCHLTFADTEFGPPHAPLLALLKERGLAPTIICESAGTQAEDAATLAKTYAAL